jgi:hypothetical protein
MQILLHWCALVCTGVKNALVYTGVSLCKAFYTCVKDFVSKTLCQRHTGVKGHWCTLMSRCVLHCGVPNTARHECVGEGALGKRKGGHLYGVTRMV